MTVTKGEKCFQEGEEIVLCVGHLGNKSSISKTSVPLGANECLQYRVLKRDSNFRRMRTKSRDTAPLESESGQV